jgi:hypothetical protein
VGWIGEGMRQREILTESGPSFVVRFIPTGSQAGF